MPEPQKPVISTICHDCQGDKAKYQPTLYVGSNRLAGTISVPKACPTCGGEGRLPGFQIPA